MRFVSISFSSGKEERGFALEEVVGFFQGVEMFGVFKEKHEFVIENK